MLKITIALNIRISLHIQNTVQQEAFECGVIQAKTAALILNGENAQRDEWPWHVALFTNSNDSLSYICGGTLISEKFVLTAAHCVFSPDTGDMLPPSDITAQMGRFNMKMNDTEIIQQYEVLLINIYSNFTRKSLRDDIALLQLRTSVEFNEYVQPACVDQVLNLAGQNGTTVGWGLTENDSLAEILQKVTMPVIDDTKCLASDRDYFSQIIAENVFCAGYTNGTGVCNGDSGGGLVFERNGVWYVGGIVSHSKSRSFDRTKCSLDGYRIFTRVQRFIPWIVRTTGLSFSEGENAALTNNNRHPICKTRKVNPQKTTSALLPKFCGMRLVDGDNQTAGLYEFPWMAKVMDTERYCTGTLINKRYVLTIASCPVLYSESVKVRLGEHTIEKDEDGNVDGEYAPAVQDYAIQCLSYHPDYDTPDIKNDILLIRLHKNVAIDDHIQPVCLPTTAALQQMEPPSEYIVSGWESKYVVFERPLRKLPIQHRNISECLDHDSPNYRELQLVPVETLNAFRICAIYNRTSDICIYDSGSPAGYEVDNRFVQFGIATSPNWCHFPETFLRVASFMDWIVANIVA